MIAQSGYPELSTLIDLEQSNLLPPDARTLLRATFDGDADAARLDFPPETEAFRLFGDDVLVALAGESAVVRVDPERRLILPFVFNTRGQPASADRRPGDALERPVAVVTGPDGAVYVIDHGRTKHEPDGPRTVGHTGKIYRLAAPIPATQPAIIE
jgi:hypothetical protein